jgi:hypothetical protein
MFTVLWEIFTLSIPWRNMDYFQILRAVDKQCLRLPIDTLLPKEIVDLINDLFGDVDTRPDAKETLSRLTNFKNVHTA